MRTKDALKYISKLETQNAELLEACKAALTVGEIAFGTCRLSRDVGERLKKAITKTEAAQSTENNDSTATN